MQVKSNTHKILTTSLVLGYLYLLMTTTFYGYSNYFNLPLSDSLFSPQVPFLFFFDLSRIIFNVLINLPLMVIVSFILIIACLTWMYFFTRITKYLVLVGGVVLLIYIPFGFYNFGGALASISTEFYTSPSECIPGATDSLYIVPTLYGDLEHVVFVSIDPDSRVLRNGFLPRNTSDLLCQLTKQTVGKVIKP
ncbi:hypothetical protein A3I99_03595 [Candidatus Kaiserbacteria bacterium RIFCSPLOWO2_02_FULL_45_11b]|uniref:Uncharacterized protein n=1 Tax=Candidatus Kaiserbacteria bacterium RIFCSPLOWO2_12_FULL_45_26 TaxID=1798525 RepID=A0A1F6FH31_9BACT|nr:MAG: hypothetical protein A2929_02530 [Candidatus Kaiserbacteria bacterium RIFCSPLOWO2_01_FULL_45_25]OGG83676.1 MAG: hypothetical protein A3I99_03595 [Candidatus Kaiserbacteria bacterium RIFCSPLOWO2_02_FULL_45_11b]OGG85168.1 MAG: hypothetical protein A3G90_03880 [Candidatus Kaiserbacteria bacterium RIFCSPLOWO2_12_FULL_45_26]